MEGDHAYFDYIILADYAQALNGKLYLMGGNWNRIQIASYTLPVRVNAAMCLLVPWRKSNDRLPIKVTVVDMDGKLVAAPFSTTTVAGRTADSIYGQPIAVTITYETFAVVTQKGIYSVVAEVTDDGEDWRTSARFFIHAFGEDAT